MTDGRAGALELCPCVAASFMYGHCEKAKCWVKVKNPKSSAMLRVEDGTS
jgi:hypothetical protein